MCGIAGVCGTGWQQGELQMMQAAQSHRGPDDAGIYNDPSGIAGLAHNRLSIIDLSPAGHQPMVSADAGLVLVFNGEIYNYLELKRELNGYPFRGNSDSEVILAAYERWGVGCLDRLLGMFAFALWDPRERKLFAARDRFGVKPFRYHLRADGTLFFASEIAALHAGGVPREADPVTWATYLAHGVSDHTNRTFWRGIESLPPGHALIWENNALRAWCWYDLAERVGPAIDAAPERQVREQYLSLLDESVMLRFRADVPVGINISGGLDSSTLLALVQRLQGGESDVTAFTFATGDARYDELPWVRQMLERTRHPSVVAELAAEDVPGAAESLQAHLLEPFGGIPTLAYARLFERARSEGVVVLLDGQGMDEQWAGYDYYERAAQSSATLIQGSRDAALRPDCLAPAFRALAEPFAMPHPFSDAVQNLQYRDARFTKIPKALRFNDGISMRASTELREPFMDHRLFELALRQPGERKIFGGRRKVLLRDVMAQLLGDTVVEAPKRPVQTPQREWLRGPLRDWAGECINDAVAAWGSTWVDRDSVRSAWLDYCAGEADNSFFVWQWVTLGMLSRTRPTTPTPLPAFSSF
jgi:asparagine synthase (glutamine-hydrolysing)